jgi:hypothetical protein
VGLSGGDADETLLLLGLGQQSLLVFVGVRAVRIILEMAVRARA